MSSKEYIVIPRTRIEELVADYDRLISGETFENRKQTNISKFALGYYQGRLLEIKIASRMIKDLLKDASILTIPVNNNKNGT